MFGHTPELGLKGWNVPPKAAGRRGQLAKGQPMYAWARRRAPSI